MEFEIDNISGMRILFSTIPGNVQDAVITLSRSTHLTDERRLRLVSLGKKILTQGCCDQDEAIDLVSGLQSPTRCYYRDLILRHLPLVRTPYYCQEVPTKPVWKGRFIPRIDGDPLTPTWHSLLFCTVTDAFISPYAPSPADELIRTSFQQITSCVTAERDKNLILTSYRLLYGVSRCSKVLGKSFSALVRNAKSMERAMDLMVFASEHAHQICEQESERWNSINRAASYYRETFLHRQRDPFQRGYLARATIEDECPQLRDTIRFFIMSEGASYKINDDPTCVFLITNGNKFIRVFARFVAV
jgi:hypothetical protein